MDALIQEVAAELAGMPSVLAVVLVGSAARGQADQYSDLDFHVIVAAGRPPDQVFYRGGRLVTVSFIDQAHAERTLADPKAALWGVLAARQARMLHDPQGWYADYQRRAWAFTWSAVEAGASALISQHLSGSAEAAHKMVGGLTSGQLERALYAAHGALRAMAEVSALARGHLIESENRYWSTVRDHEPDPLWRALFWSALGFGSESPEGRALAAARLYARSVQLFEGHLRPADRAVAWPAARSVAATLGKG